MVRPVISLFLILLIGCAPKSTVREIQLFKLNDEIAQIDPSENSLTIIYFLSPECPLCINYVLAMREIEKEFAADSIVFYGVHSKEWFEPNEVEEYQLKYGLKFSMLLDDGNQLARTLGATVTPEVFVLNRNSELQYSGKIDNWVNDLGKKKLEVSEHYLKNALLAWQDGKTIETKSTEPVGCLIE